MANRLPTRIEGVSVTSDQALKLEQLDRGWLGRVFGESGHMVYYIALLCVLVSSAAFFWGGPGGAPYATSVLTFAGGLIGGRGFRQ
jgi:hypothetical protein